MYISGSTENLQRMLTTEINESRSMAKIRIWVQSDCEAFRIICSEKKVSLLILSWLNFSCPYIQRTFLIFKWAWNVFSNVCVQGAQISRFEK